MRIALFGATGGIGRRLLVRLLLGGHAVTTVSRRPGVVTEGPATHAVVGDVTDPETVARAVVDQDAVISALGVATTRPDTTLSVGTGHIVSAMSEHGVSRLLVISGNGLGINGGPVVDRLLTPTLLRHVKTDAQAQEYVITASGLRWTIVRPFRLVDRRPPSVRYRVAESFPTTVLARWTTRDDAARALAEHLDDAGPPRVLWVASGGR
jgi:putative NADH-flavin reductase